MRDIRELAPKLADIPTDVIDAQLREFIREGEDKALSRLLQVAAFNQLTLDPELLCEAIGVCEEITDTAPCFAFQTADIVPFLLTASGSEALSIERRVYAAAIAAELTVQHKLDPQPARKALWKLEGSLFQPAVSIMKNNALLLLDAGKPVAPGDVFQWSNRKIEDVLPEKAPHAIIGGTYTVRRAVPKLGRNDPCHCGSGKKYKKCCFASDQDLLNDASQYAGMTRDELKHNPGLVDDPDIINRMRAYELKKLKPADLGNKQLYAAYLSAADFGLRELAFEMLVEWQKRDDKGGFHTGHFEDLIALVLDAGELDLARRIRDHMDGESWFDPDDIQFRFELLEHPEHFESLEKACRQSIIGKKENKLLGDPLIRLTWNFERQFPGLAIVFARAAILSTPERSEDHLTLLDVIRDSRIDLDLDPYDDPGEKLAFQAAGWTLSPDRRASSNADIDKLSKKLETTRLALEENKRALREKEQHIAAISQKLDKARAAARRTQRASQEPTASQDSDHATLKRLRGKVEQLKSEISEQQKQRQRLRHELSEERKKKATRAESEKTGPATDAPPREEASVEASGHPLVPEYSAAFRKHCEALPPRIAAKAILDSGRFAALDPPTLQRTRPLHRLPSHYRIRVNADYRLIIQWRPGKTLVIRDIIPRQDLESWIKRHG